MIVSNLVRLYSKKRCRPHVLHTLTHSGWQTPIPNINIGPDKGCPSLPFSPMFLRHAASIFDTAEVWNLPLLVAIVPAAYALLGGVVILSRWVLARFGVKRWFWTFDDFLTLPEAENFVYGYELEDHSPAKISSSQSVPPFRTLLVIIGLFGLTIWSAFATYQLGLKHATADAYLILQLLLRILPWVLGAFQAVRYSTQAPPWSLFGLYVVLFASSVFFVAGAAYGYYIHHIPYARPNNFVHVLELLLVATALITVLQIPVATPHHGPHIEEVR